MHTEQVFTDETYNKVFGFKEREEIDFAENLMHSLHKIDPTLLPMPTKHLYAEWIAKGSKGLKELFRIYETTVGEEQIYAIDAIAQIYLNAGSTSESNEWLWERMEQATDARNKDQIAKCLAIGGDEIFLREQLSRLADEDPAIVASAARFLGYGCYGPALPALRALVSPARIYESRHVIWAIGEIGAQDALPELERALEQGFRSNDCLMAIGKIGLLGSVPKIMPFLQNGLPDQKEVAFQALAMILNANAEYQEVIKPLQDLLVPIIMGQLESEFADFGIKARFYMLLCLARLNYKMEKSLVRKYLGIDMGEKEAGDLASFFMKK